MTHQYRGNNVVLIKKEKVMELREALKVLDSDAHARDLDDFIRPYLDEPYRNQKAPFPPRDTYDRNLGGSLGHSGARHQERLAAMDQQEIDSAVMYPTISLGRVGLSVRPESGFYKHGSRKFGS